MDKPEFIDHGQLISDNTYYCWIETVKNRFHSTQAKAAVRVNTEMLRFYWGLGRDLVQMKAESRWGSGVLKQVSIDLRDSFPDVKGFSYVNIRRMSQWYRFYNQPDINCSQAVSNLEMPEIFGRVPWSHHLIIITHSKSIDEALFYINETIKNNWSRHTLEDKMKANLYEIRGAAITNFEERLPADFVPKATSILKDPYIFDFLELPNNYDEHDLENALVNNITRFMLELGNGFSFIGRQVELRMDDGTSFSRIFFFTTIAPIIS